MTMPYEEDAYWHSNSRYRIIDHENEPWRRTRRLVRGTCWRILAEAWFDLIEDKRWRMQEWMQREIRKLIWQLHKAKQWPGSRQWREAEEQVSILNDVLLNLTEINDTDLDEVFFSDLDCMSSCQRLLVGIPEKEDPGPSPGPGPGRGPYGGPGRGL